MTGQSWFTSQKTVRHPLVFPGVQEEADRLRRGGDTVAADELLAENTGWVELRGLSSGDRAELDELKFTEKGEGKLSMGESKMRTVELCLTAWSADEPLSAAAIRGLEPFVLDAIFALIPDGRFVGAAGRANGSGPPPLAAVDPLPAEHKDASLTA